MVFKVIGNFNELLGDDYYTKTKIIGGNDKGYPKFEGFNEGDYSWLFPLINSEHKVDFVSIISKKEVDQMANMITKLKESGLCEFISPVFEFDSNNGSTLAIAAKSEISTKELNQRCIELGIF